VIGYPIELAGGLLIFPFAAILLVLFSVLDGTFLIVAIPVLLIVYVLMTIALSRAFIGIIRRLLLGSDRNSLGKRKNSEPHGPNSDLWDRWIDP
jgi:hypothetical protein